MSPIVATRSAHHSLLESLIKQYKVTRIRHEFHIATPFVLLKGKGKVSPVTN